MSTGPASGEPWMARTEAVCVAVDGTGTVFGELPLHAASVSDETAANASAT
jgi:hypothetical protein